jgi:uncharacterized SAM-binding protein YcdF (DUF218 family)
MEAGGAATAPPKFALWFAGVVGMSMARPKIEDATGEWLGQTRPGGPQGRLLRAIGWFTLGLCATFAVLLTAGFLWFVWRLPVEEVVLDRNADGIVALTGGASRISDAIELLAAGRGQRLLISGANRATTPDEISRLNPEFSRVVHCCVDFDRALNTLGNAVETRRWARARGFQSLIVVTSNYHMPRAMTEIGHQLPNVVLVPFPVVPDILKSEPWWRSAATVRLLLLEYLKYIVANARARFNHVTDA